MPKSFTNEELSGLFPDNFKLANHAIVIAQHLIRAGREVSAPALLDELRKNPDRYDLDDLKATAERLLEESDEHQQSA